MLFSMSAMRGRPSFFAMPRPWRTQSLMEPFVVLPLRLLRLLALPVPLLLLLPVAPCPVPSWSLASS
jgi:hypothetical protein